jgi:membrane protein involved in colicin uptake
MVAPATRLPHLVKHTTAQRPVLRHRRQQEEKEPPMARKPNYSFERQERDRADAKKAAEKAAAKAEKKAAAAARKEAGLPPLED